MFFIYFLLYISNNYPRYRTAKLPNTIFRLNTNIIQIKYISDKTENDNYNTNF